MNEWVDFLGISLRFPSYKCINFLLKHTLWPSWSEITQLRFPEMKQFHVRIVEKRFFSVLLSDWGPSWRTVFFAEPCFTILCGWSRSRGPGMVEWTVSFIVSPRLWHLLPRLPGPEQWLLIEALSHAINSHRAIFSDNTLECGNPLCIQLLPIAKFWHHQRIKGVNHPCINTLIRSFAFKTKKNGKRKNLGVIALWTDIRV